MCVCAQALSSRRVKTHLAAHEAGHADSQQRPQRTEAGEQQGLATAWPAGQLAAAAEHTASAVIRVTWSQLGLPTTLTVAFSVTRYLGLELVQDVGATEETEQHAEQAPHGARALGKAGQGRRWDGRWDDDSVVALSLVGERLAEALHGVLLHSSTGTEVHHRRSVQSGRESAGVNSVSPTRHAYGLSFEQGGTVATG